MLNKYQENIISAVDQNKYNIYFHGEGDFKLMLLGNSILKHAPKPEVGWTNDCGMAASLVENDYAHILVKKIEEHLGKKISWAIIQVANFERNFAPERIDELYFLAKDYNPDLMIMFFGANVSKDYDTAENPEYKFSDSVEKLRNYLIGEKTKVLWSEGFYVRPVLDKEKEKVAAKYGDMFVSLEDIRARDDTHGRFNHPSDIGMSAIADRFFEKIKNTL